jgi:sugar (pentulose or hexulose) kinase
MSRSLVAGLDLGSTGVKILVTDETGEEVCIRQRPTPWRAGSGGTTEMDADALLGTIAELLAAVAEELPALCGGPVRIEALAVAGMGESGLVLEAGGTVVAPAFAWFDPRGLDQVESMPAPLREEFAGRTGLPLGAQVSVAKLAFLRDAGLDLAGKRWFNLPEYVVAALGGEAAAEYSLASRTGLLDQDSGEAWTGMLEYLGVGPDFLPPLRDAGSLLGAALADWLPESFRGASLTVAGHDHLVSMVSAGDIPADHYHVSMGTAEVLVRVIDEPLPFDARVRLGKWLINCVRHVVPGRYALVAGVKTGLLMRRALHLFGITDRDGRDRLDDAVMSLPPEGTLAEGAIEVMGARNDDGVLRLALRVDGADPAEVFGAILRHGNDEIRLLIDAMDRELPPARSALLTGGWAGMRSVQRARSAVLPSLRVSGLSQDTAYGAALFARQLLGPASPAQVADPGTRPVQLS